MDKLPTKKFIHHSSNDYNNADTDEDPEFQIHHEFSFLVSYVSTFGAFTAKVVKFWPMVNRLMDILKTDLAGLNKYLHKAHQDTF